MKALFILPIILILAVLSVNAAGNLTITGAPQILSGNVTETISGNFTLNNTGSTNLSITFSSTQLTGTKYNISSSKISFSPSSVSVLNTTELKLINFSVALSGTNAYAGNYTGTINASSNITGNHDSFQLNITVNSAPSATVNNTNITNVVKGHSKTGQFLLSNTGNTNLSSISLSVSNLVNDSNVIGSGNITLSKTSTSLNYTQTEVLTVTVAVPSTQATGTYTGNITANYGSGNATETLTVNVVAAATTLVVDPSSLTLAAKLNTTESDTFTVNNTGTLDINNIAITLSGLSAFSVQFNETSFNLSAGASRKIKVNATIPEEKDIGTYTGTVTIGNSTVSTTMTLKVRVKSFLEINDLDIEVDNDKDSNVGDGDTISPDARPESHIEFDVKIKNTYNKNIDDEISDIDNIFIRVTLEDIDEEGEDLEEESDEFDLNADETHRETLEFDLSLEVEEGEYNVVIYVEGQDGNGVEHTDKFEIKLDVDKRTHEIITRVAEFSPETISCSRKTYLYTEFMNIGRQDEDEVYYKIENAALGINIKEAAPYEIDSNIDDDENTFEKTFTFTIADNVQPGTYPIQIRTYYDKDRISNLKIVNLIVEDCVEVEEVVEEEKEEKEEELAKPEAPTPETGPIITKPETEIIDTTKVSFFDSPTYMAILIAANIIILGAVVGFVIKRLQKP